ncbi:EAL domain-containing protein [Chelatococcus sp. SYSU_G07232]|uniref:EAL domain-containing protein n=1 Tax=Chelatococcus albus TaxID=3047466 RepID=A0ABT7AEI9_9HYPH|nr:EAL domain-containing protein [Chelatococcus sp. SYSU_G07232]MDJ1157784.1 EAL domain-containing protein [Chelatococcus sp. SYSU_G07232]
MLLALAIGVFVAAAAYLSYLIIERHRALESISRYNITFTVAQGINEFVRFERSLDAYAHGDVDKDEVQLRYDILSNRLRLFRDSEFREFTDLSPDREALVADLERAYREIEPLVRDIDQPGARRQILAILDPLQPRLVGLGSQANQYGGQLAARDQAELLRLQWLFSALVAGLIGSGAWLIVLLLTHNSLLTRAHNELRAVTVNLRHQEEMLRTQNNLFDAALNNMSQGLCMFDGGHRLIVANERYAWMYGLPPGELRAGMTLREILERIVAHDICSQEGADELFTNHQAAGDLTRPAGFLHTLRDGRIIAVSQRAMPDGGWVATYEDITERQRTEARIAYLARHDALTKLPNRIVFHERVAQALARARRHGDQLAVLYLDLDHFKNVNDTLGHAVGDALLRSVAERLRSVIREEDTIARLGGDEFAIVQLAIKHPADAGQLARRIVEALSQPFDLGDHQVLIGTSVGIAVAPANGEDADQLMKHADIALYDAKSEGRSTYRFFEPQMDQRLQARRALELDLRGALEHGEFELHFQPLVNLTSRKIICFEALVRWAHPERGLVPPSEFIPVAEEIGLIVPIGEWILRQACSEAMHWPEDISVAVNLSSIQFQRSNVVRTVSQTLLETGLPANRLELEITETVLLQESDETLTSLHALRALGVRLSMDDFGTGYSSLNYIRRFPFDKIKIDQCFVQDVATNKDSLTIVHTIVALGRSLEMTTTAEGVETQEQLTMLRAAGCAEAQGSLFGMPTPASGVAALLQKPNPVPDIRSGR